MKKKCIGLLGASGNYKKIDLFEINQILSFALKNYDLIDISTDYGLEYNLVSLLKNFDFSQISSKLIYKVGCNLYGSYDSNELLSNTIDDINSIGLKRFDCILFHRPSVTKLESDIKFFNMMRIEYPKTSFGICTNSIEIYDLYKQNIEVNEVQFALNPLDYFSNLFLLKKLIKDGVSMQPRSVLSNGLLSGKYKSDSFFDDPLRRRFNEPRNRKKFLKRIKMSNLIIDYLKKEHKLSSKQIPIFLYSLFGSIENVKCVVRGGSSLEQIKTNLKSFVIRESHQQKLFDLMKDSWSCEYV